MTSLGELVDAESDDGAASRPRLIETTGNAPVRLMASRRTSWVKPGTRPASARMGGVQGSSGRGVLGTAVLIWPHCGGLNWPHLRPTGGRLFGAHRAQRKAAKGMGSRVETFEQIRRDRDREGLSIRALAERHGVHRRAVRQALASPVPPAKRNAGVGRRRSWGLPGADRRLA